MAKATKSGNNAKAGISGTSTTQATTSRKDAGKEELTQKQQYINAYIDAKQGGQSAEEATQAARKASGMKDYTELGKSGRSAAERALDAGDAYYDAATGRILLTQDAESRVGNRTYTEYEKNGPAQNYVNRVLKTQAEQNPRFSEQGEDSTIPVIPDFSTGRIERMTPEQYAAMAAKTLEEQSNRENPILRMLKGLGGQLTDTLDRSFIQASGTAKSNWTSAGPTGSTAGADGAKPGTEDQAGTGKRSAVTSGTVTQPQAAPLQQYFYPEDPAQGIRFQNTSPFTEDQKAIIDEMNRAMNDRDYSSVAQLQRIYQEKTPEAWTRYQYERSLPEGADPYAGMQEAIASGDKTAYDSAQGDLRAHGYSQDTIDTRTADVIRQSDKSTQEKEHDLQNYLGLSPTDAQATTILWWWEDTNGKASADADGNGRLKQDELGAFLQDLERSGTISQAQAEAIWSTNKTWKKTYGQWKGAA